MLRKRYAALFLALSVFTVVSLGSVRSSAQVREIRAMHAEDPEARDFLVLTDHEPRHSIFTERSLACAVTSDQANALEHAVAGRTRHYEMNGRRVRVVYVQGNPESRRVVREVVGARLEDSRKARVVEESWVIPLLSPGFVS